MLGCDDLCGQAVENMPDQMVHLSYKGNVGSNSASGHRLVDLINTGKKKRKKKTKGKRGCIQIHLFTKITFAIIRNSVELKINSS